MPPVRKSKGSHSFLGSTSRARLHQPAQGRLNSNGSTRSIFIGLTAALILVLVSWVCVIDSSSHRSPQRHKGGERSPLRGQLGKKDDRGQRSLHGGHHGKRAGSDLAHPKLGKKDDSGRISSSHEYHIEGAHIKPRVIGIYAYQMQELDGWKAGRGKRDVLPPYIYLAERIDPHLLSHASQTLRRMRHHSYYRPGDIKLSDAMHNYNQAIAGSDAEVRSEDPLLNLMLTSDSRDVLREIREDSEDYARGLAEPLDDGECEATPKNSQWMAHSFPTCNHVHEFDFTLAMRKKETWLLGHGYWRDVWPVLDLEPSTLSLEKKVALKTIRYEHDHTERNFHRHIRDAIVSERMSSSPRVTSTYSFCGHSGYFEFATGGSLADRLEKHYTAKFEEDNDAKSDSNDDKILTQREKLVLAHEAAAGLADFHDTDPMRDENGTITSASMVHADITVDQFVIVDGVYKLNDFNRCRFMRRYRGSDRTHGGDGKPCGFRIGNNPGKNRSPEEYAYTIETEKIDIYSFGNVLYSILTDGLEAWEDVDDEQAQREILKGRRPKLPKKVKSSTDFADVALRKIMWKCWAHEPEDRPRARAVADFLVGKLVELDHKDGTKSM